LSPWPGLALTVSHLSARNAHAGSPGHHEPIFPPPRQRGYNRGMSEWTLILAGPNFEGLSFTPFAEIALVFSAAVLCVIAHDFRLTMKHPPLRRGLLYRVAVGVIFAMGLFLAAAWVIGRL
jgi:hypothetical protein